MMFYNLSTITAIDFNDCINTAAVTNMNYMFCSCYNISSLDLCSFTFNATDYSSMFLSTGISATSRPIPIYVKDETDKQTLEAGSTNINNNYAKIEVKNN